MGEAMPRKCIPNACNAYECGRMEPSLEKEFVWVLEEGLQRRLMADHTVAASLATVKPMEEGEEDKELEGEEEEGMEEGKVEGSSTKVLVPTTKWAAELRILPPAAPKF